MAMYTFRRGQRVHLTKDPSRLLVDGDPTSLEGVGLRGRLVAPAQVLIETDHGGVDSKMEECRAGNHVAHHVYYLDGEELFITDQVIEPFVATTRRSRRHSSWRPTASKRHSPFPLPKWCSA
eukprot:TRINITY_DN17724_c0_g1_i1.p1 TRINITY_DN17724_c0_g1~~TRINITY_DN17724_c0_g1_i1.p1  ORF type:complete len:122 (-),score=4.09 TRINITY_DN17724_c0_g1_i1:219-584(-)